MTENLEDIKQSLRVLRTMLEQRPVTIDSGVIEKNKTLMLILYGAVMKMGITMNAPGGVVVTAQVPVIAPPKNHDLRWEISADQQSVLLYITDTEKETEPVAPPEKVTGLEEPVEISTGPDVPLVGPDEAVDEFEDAVFVGMDDDYNPGTLAEQDKVTREEMDDGN